MRLLIVTELFRHIMQVVRGLKRRKRFVMGVLTQLKDKLQKRTANVQPALLLLVVIVSG